VRNKQQEGVNMAGDLDKCLSLTAEYNESSLIASINRVMDMHVIDDPILLNAKEGMYAVHDHVLIGDDIKLYTKQEFDEEFADKKPISYAQYVEDRNTISENRFHERMPAVATAGNGKLSGMNMRIEQIEKDAKEFGIELDTKSGVEVLPNPPSDDPACKF